MIFLFASIVLTTFLAVAFKICHRLNIDSFQAIVFNYLTCIVIGLVMGGSKQIINAASFKWFPWALLLGSLFIIFFNLTALTVRVAGIAVASVATKLSLIIPFIFSLIYYGEKAGIVKWAGVILALLSVILTCWPSVKNNNEGVSKLLRFILISAVFVGTGTIDTLIKFTEQQFIIPGVRDTFLVTCFATAGVIGFFILAGLMVTGRKKFQPRAIIAGIAIGLPNYFSIWCLVLVLEKYHYKSSVILPVNNIGIVFLGALVAWIIFHESLKTINWLGILLAISSILLIASNL